MTRAPSCALPLLAALTLAACTDQPDSAPTAPAEPAAQAPDLPPVEPGTSQDIEGVPPALTAEAERGEKGATNLMLSFVRAAETGRLDEAYALLGEAGRNRWTAAQFRQIFDGLGPVTAGFTPGTVEGAAGSLVYETALTITANDAEGRPVRIEGPVVLRRVNDVAGAAPAQLRWHFSQIALDHTH